MDPVVPPVDRENEEDYLQSHICIELDLVEHHHEEEDVDDANWPAPDSLLDGEPD